ncbi:flagellar export protein FliJ [Dethiothermospora halolimnae]|uniref:flagellar export protein FliJ n=1 Tax=Dethiothermospora halolimnae TaxID=3114390 RepID=UPI003CCB8854
MKKFDFRLQKILEYKETIEQTKKTQYSREKRILDKEEDKLNEYVNKKKHISDERNEKIGRTTVGYLKNSNSYLHEINKAIKKQKKVVDNQKNNLYKAKQKLIESVKDKKSIEKLKEKDYENFLYLQRKEEEKVVDQIVSFSASNR